MEYVDSMIILCLRRTVIGLTGVTQFTAGHTSGLTTSHVPTCGHTIQNCADIYVERLLHLIILVEKLQDSRGGKPRRSAVFAARPTPDC